MAFVRVIAGILSGCGQPPRRAWGGAGAAARTIHRRAGAAAPSVRYPRPFGRARHPTGAMLLATPQNLYPTAIAALSVHCPRPSWLRLLRIGWAHLAKKPQALRTAAGTVDNRQSLPLRSGQPVCRPVRYLPPYELAAGGTQPQLPTQIPGPADAALPHDQAKIVQVVLAQAASQQTCGQPAKAVRGGSARHVFRQER